MKHRDKFPPNKFLKRTLMKTPGRFALFIIALVFLVVGGGIWFPQTTAMISFIGVMIWLPVAIITLVWKIIWDIRNPAPPSEYCPTCHQTLPEKNEDE